MGKIYTIFRKKNCIIFKSVGYIYNIPSNIDDF